MTPRKFSLCAAAILGLSVCAAWASHMDEAARRKYLESLEQDYGQARTEAERWRRLEDDARRDCQTRNIGCGSEHAFAAKRMEAEARAGDIRKEHKACERDIATCGHYRERAATGRLSDDEASFRMRDAATGAIRRAREGVSSLER